VTHLAKGNTALSISMTAAASTLATVMLPFNLMFWGQINPTTNTLLTSIDVSGSALLVNLLLVLALPLALGLFIQHQWPALAKPLHKYLKNISVVALIAFIVVAVYRNQGAFSAHFGLIFTVVLVHNALALTLGFLAGKMSGLATADIKATTIEVGMQNSSLAIAIVFTQFNAEAGMALICAFWGTWHIVSGLLIAVVFNRYPKPVLVGCEESR
jgi:BASS family bile acid:Na+ symporter